MNTIRINGSIFNGNDLNIVGGKIMINGVEVNPTLNESKILKVEILSGTIHNLTCDASVECGNVTGDIDAGNSVKCGDVTGNVKAGNSVNCGDIEGKVKAGNSINCRSHK